MIPFSDSGDKEKCKYLLLKQMKIILPNNTGRWSKENKGLSAWHIFMNISSENPKVKGRKRTGKHLYFSGLMKEVKGFSVLEEVQIETMDDSDELQRVFISGDGAVIDSATTYVGLCG